MKKLHWMIGERTACRPHTNDKLKREIAPSITAVTCIPCLRALGLNKIVMRTSADSAKALMKFPGAGWVECLISEFEMRIESAPALPDDAFDENGVMSFIGKRPEPITLKMELTESGRQAIHNLLFNMGLKK